MSNRVAFLRGVNVGGARRLPMAELRAALEHAGFARVRTHLQSGNVLVRSQGLEARDDADAIRAAIAGAFGLDVEVFAIECSELACIVAENPLLGDEAVPVGSLHALLLSGQVPDELFAGLTIPAADGERAVLGQGVVYLSLPHGMGRTKLSGAYFERALGQLVTARNWRTMVALVQMCESEA